MRQTRVLIAGKSLLSLLVARELDRQLANRPEVDVLFITNEAAIIPSTSLTSVVKLPKAIKKKPLLPHTKVVVDQVRSINLSRKLVVATDGSHHFDYLFLDQIPSYSVAELTSLKASFKTLLAQMRRTIDKDMQIIARLALHGSDVSSYQLALALASDRDRECPDLRSHLKVSASFRDSLGDFLDTEGIDKLSQERLPGIKILPARPYLPSSKIRGLAIDDKGRAITDASFVAKGNRWVMVCDGSRWENHNMGLGYAELAHQIASNIIKQLEEEKPAAVESLSRAYLLRGRSGALLKWGRTVSSRLRAKMAIAGEKQLWKRLVQID